MQSYDYTSDFLLAQNTHLLIYTPGWKETISSNVSCLETRRKGSKTILQIPSDSRYIVFPPQNSRFHPSPQGSRPLSSSCMSNDQQQ